MVLLNSRNDLSYLHHHLIARLLMNDVRGCLIVTISLIYNVSCFQFASHSHSHAAASISQLTNSIVLPLSLSSALTLTPLPHAPSAPLMQRCTLDNVKCIGLYQRNKH